MPWIFFILALGCIALAMNTQSMGFALILLLASLGFMLAGALGLVSARIQARSQGGGGMQLNPALERERLRQQRGAGGAAPVAASDGSPVLKSRRDQEPDDGGADAGGDGGGGGD